MTRQDINERALRAAQELEPEVEEGSKIHNLFRITIKSAANDTENKAFEWILKNFGSEAAQRYSSEVE